PTVDLDHERRAGDFVREAIRDGRVTSCHDVSDGGLAVAVAEMAMASGIGAAISLPTPGDSTPVLFGEDQGRYILTVPRADKQLLREIVDAGAARGLVVASIGETGGRELQLPGTRAISVAELKARHESWFPEFMD
ncbi:MAG: AIR synthase-related protein, partial [Aliihoeflea sp.]